MRRRRRRDRLPLFELAARVQRDAVNAERDAAIDLVEGHANDRRPAFSAEARAFVLRYLQAHGPTAGEVLTEAAKAEGIVPHDDRAFGGVYMSLVRQKAIVKVGAVRRERGHGTAGGNVWALEASA